MIIIGVDNGNANTKTANFVFPTGIEVHDYEPPMASEVLFYNDHYYTLTTERNTYLRDKTENLDTFILTLFSIAKEINHRDLYKPGKITIDLAVGLPPEHFAALKDKFKNYFFRSGEDILFDYQGKPFHISVNEVYVFPQAFATVADKLHELQDFSRYYVVDIGGYTVDILMLANGNPQSYRSLENGIIRMSSRIRSKVNTDLSVNIEESHVQDVLLGRRNIIPTHIKEKIIEEANLYAVELVDEIREIGVDLMLNPSTFCGGGALLLEKPLLQSGKISEFSKVENDISANAKGYEFLVKSLTAVQE